ncbi:MAG: DegV family protein, partial [Acidimicrobiales bacterium]
RTRAKALAAIAAVARAHAPLDRLAVVHGDAPDVDAFAQSVADIACNNPLVISDIGPVVGTHAGPGIIGLCWAQP